VRLRQSWPLAGIGIETVLVVALTARIEDPAARQHVDSRARVRHLQEIDDDRSCGLAAADHAHALGDLLVLQPPTLEPVAAPVEHARVVVRLACDLDWRPASR
jgi:hypothetical protein